MAKAIEALTPERLRELLHYDPETGLFTRKYSYGRFKSGMTCGCTRPDGYVAICVGGSSYLAHRLAWLYMVGSWPASIIDHINMLRDDNRFCNLRQATKSQNAFNARPGKNNSSGRTGVSFVRRLGRYVAYCKINRKRIHIGYFDDIDTAYAAYRSRLSCVGDFVFDQSKGDGCGSAP